MNTRNFAPTITNSQLLQLMALIGVREENLAPKQTKRRLFIKKELDELDKWMKAHCSTSLEDSASRLYGILIQDYPRFDEKTLQQSHLIRALFPKMTVNERSKSYLRKTMTQLTRMVEDYFIHKHIRQNDGLRINLLSQVFRSRGKLDWYLTGLRQQIEILEDKKDKYVSDYGEIAMLYRTLFQEPSGSVRHDPQSNVLQAFEQNLDLHYFLQKVILANEKREIRRVLPTSNDSNDLDLQQDQLLWSTNAVKNRKADDLALGLYLDRLNGENDSYERIKKAVRDMDLPLSSSDRKTMFFWLINDTARNRLHSDEEQDALKELLKLYRFGIESKLLFNYERISDRSYFNIVTVSNMCKAFEYTRAFIEDQTKRLPKGQQVAARHWAEAHYFYYNSEEENNIQKCLQWTAKVHKKYHIFTIQLRILEIKLRYQMVAAGDSKPQFLHSALESSQKWIKKDPDSSLQQKTVFTNFIKMVRKIAGRKTPLNGDSKKKLLDSLQREKLLHSRGWLQEQIENL